MYLTEIMTKMSQIKSNEINILQAALLAGSELVTMQRLTNTYTHMLLDNHTVQQQTNSHIMAYMLTIRQGIKHLSLSLKSSIETSK